jgi:hypothetical protein
LNLRDTNTGIAAEGFNQIFGGDNRMYLYAGGSGASSYMQFYTNDVERMRINSAGRLIIGRTTDSGAPFNLQVDGRILQTGQEFLFEGDNDKRITVYSARPLSFATSDTERMRITSDGSLLVGTTSQTYSNSTYGYIASFKGALTTQSYISVSLSNQASTSEGMLFGLSDAAGAIYVLDNKPLVLYTNSTEKMRITAGGNVGIGTTNPANRRLVVSSNINDEWVGSFIHTGTNPYGLFVDTTANTSGGYTFAAYTFAGGGFYIKNSGNVLIGTATDSGFKLRVNGEILADDDIRIFNTFALVLNGTDNNWRIGRNTITDSGWLTGNTMQMVVFGGSTGQGFQVVNSNGTALFEIDGVAGASRFTNALGVGVNPSGTAGRIDASNDIVAYSSSDLRLKENIKPIENALDKVKALTGVEFDWKAEHKEAHGYEGHDTGIIAQEVQEVMPTAVRVNDTGYLAVRYEKLIGLLVEANKELAARVEELEKKLK